MKMLFSGFLYGFVANFTQLMERSGARSLPPEAPARRNGIGGKKDMGLLVRSAAGLSLLFLILPIDVGETAGEQQQQVGPIQALFAARDAVLDLAGICERQPDVCATARAALATIVARATEAVRLAQSVGDSGQPPEAAVLPDAALPETAPAIPIPAQREASPAG